MKAITSLILALALAGCGSSARALYDDHPWLRPGATTAAAVLAERSQAAAGPALTGIDAMIRELTARSPAVAAARERWRAAVERVPQASRLPDTVAEYMWVPAPADMATGMDEHRVEVRQMIPFPTKLVAMDAEARAMARGAAQGFDMAVRDAVTRLEEAYADLWYTQRALEVLSQNEELARALSQIGATRLTAQKGLLFDVARAQAQLAQLTFDRVTLTERRDVAAARINGLLGRPATAPLVADTLPDRNVPLDEEALLGRAIESQQELAMLDEDIRGAEARLDGAASSWAPDLMLGGMFMRREPVGPGAGEPQTMGGLMVGLAIPLWGHANAAEFSEAEARLGASIQAKKAHVDGLQAELRDALFEVRNATRLRVLYDNELLPHAIAVLRNAEQARAGDQAMYADLLEARAVYYSFALARERAVADQFAAVARLERLIGAPLPQGVTP